MNREDLDRLEIIKAAKKLGMVWPRDAAASIAPQPPAAPLSEVERLRAEQTAAVMPMIGPLLDAWEWSRCVEGFKVEHSELDKQLRAIDNAMEGRTPSPSPQPTDEATDAGLYGPDCEDGPDEDGFKGPRPWNSFSSDGGGSA